MKYTEALKGSHLDFIVYRPRGLSALVARHAHAAGTTDIEARLAVALERANTDVLQRLSCLRGASIPSNGLIPALLLGGTHFVGGTHFALFRRAAVFRKKYYGITNLDVGS